MEIWKKHKEFNYEISNLGNIRRIGNLYIDKNGVEKQRETKILKPHLVSGFTAQVAFSKTENKNTIVKYFSVKKLVAEYFLPKPTEDQKLLDNIDNNPLNNRAENLRWITQDEWNIKNVKLIEKRTKNALKARAKNSKNKKKKLQITSVLQKRG